MKTRVIFCTILCLILFTGASVWEGAVTVATGRELPATGCFVATNSFPKNTIVDITNLENGESVRAIVAAGLDIKGLLAIVSKEASEKIGLSSRTVGRIRMNQPVDPIAFSRFTNDSSDSINYDLEDIEGEEVNKAVTSIPEKIRIEVSAEPSAVVYEYILKPAEERPPVMAYEIDTDNIISGIDGSEVSREVRQIEITDSLFDSDLLIADIGTDNITISDLIIPGIIRENKSYEFAEYTLGSDRVVPGVSDTEDFDLYFDNRYFTLTPSIHSIPYINSLEKGRYYVQIGTYNNVGTVEGTISSIDKIYPLGVYNSGSDSNPNYHVLLGPLNQGESGAMLRRFKTIGYKDSFIRHVN